MKTHAFLKPLSIAALCFACAASAQAQGMRSSGSTVGRAAAGAAGSDIVARITSMTKPDRSTKEFPTVQTSPNQKKLRGSKGREWAVLDVAYETAPEWIDEIQITYSVLTETPKPANAAQAAFTPKERFSFYTIQESYVNVAKGEHYASVVLPPAAITRYGKPILFGVEISVNGKSQGMKTEGRVVGIDTVKTPDWWRSDAMRQDFVASREGLKDRSRTPWAVINADDYETVK